MTIEVDMPRKKGGLEWKLPLLAALVGLPLLLGIGLTRDPNRIPSALVGKSMPAFEIPYLQRAGMLNSAEHAGKPMLLNFWASWCTTCRVEHPKLVELGVRSQLSDEFSILGINYRDDPARAAGFLNREGHFGYPSGYDERGRLGIDFGVYGMPETFFIDADGVVQARHAGPVTDKVLAKYLPLIGVDP
ncbi:thiol:disulfide interchange protein DsbE (plasmid) [Ruegeria pomeroyi DSS-3]|uniref:Thiol:disulfide interchange protein DsbE n=2 Tax=Ruegeria pomeroyi TaxID=89184 RepID=Q5LL32_RUEPO|nr:DsbE family thiol:disulfide interchange protein [Ruegeria pomeroyi]AAV97331.1 thiol:disulfide interchange protein DsbE [Ruegeria pomeroyi DSS-3]